MEFTSDAAKGRFLRLHCARWKVPFLAEQGEGDWEGERERVWRGREKGLVEVGHPADLPSSARSVVSEVMMRCRTGDGVSKSWQVKK